MRRHMRQDLLDKHLAVVAEAELKGVPEVAIRANELWRLHEEGLGVLNEMLELNLDRWWHIEIFGGDDDDEPHYQFN